MANRRKSVDANKLEALVTETIRVAMQTGAASG
jgi:hypothetical protein